MQGMLDVYKATGNKKAYAIVVNMAAYVKERMDKLSPESIEKMLYTLRLTRKRSGWNERCITAYLGYQD
jgi:hypothetical protein